MNRNGLWFKSFIVERKREREKVKEREGPAMATWIEWGRKGEKESKRLRVRKVRA